MHLYIVKASVSLENLGDAIKALAPLSTGALDIQSSEAVTAKQTRTRRTTPASATRGGNVVLEAMTEPREYTTEELGQALKDMGLTANSASATASALAREGKVKKTGRGLYLRPDTILSLT